MAESESTSVPKKSKNIRSKDLIAPYFEIDANRGVAKCKMLGCSTQLKGHHSGNLMRHLQRFHQWEADLIELQKAEMLADDATFKRQLSFSESDTSESSRSQADSESSRFPVKRQRRRAAVDIDAKTVMDGCVELVTVNGQPFSILDDSGMRCILDPLCKELNGLLINRHTVSANVRLEAEHLRKLIKEEIAGRLVCLKVDTATRLNRSVVGVNLQYCNGERLILRNLAVKEITCHRAQNLKEELIGILKDFGISTKNIYSITSDSNSEVSSQEESEEEEFKEEEIEEDTDTHAIQADIEQHIESFRGYLKSQSAVEQRCAAHTLQLAVSDAITASNEIKQLVNEIREIARQLSTPTAKGIPSTRRHSTLDIIESVTSLEDVCQDVFKDNARWDEIQLIVKALTPAKTAMKKLQSEHLLVGDFIETWMRCKLDTATIQHPLAEEIQQAIGRREKSLLETPAMSSALYMDPRWHVILDDEQRANAVAHLEATWGRIEALVETEDIDESEDGETTAPQNMKVDLTEDPLENLLKQREEFLSASEPGKQIKNLLLTLAKMPRIPRQENVLRYWMLKKESDPELCKLALTVLALPVTQISVERTFSNLRFIFEHLRTRMHPDMINNVLFVRCNKKFMVH